MVNVYKGYKIDSDDMQFTLFNETDPIGKGKSAKRNIRPIGYFNSFWNAVKYIIRLEISKEISDSCEMGRKVFMRNHGISMEDEFTVDEFIEIVKNDFGADRISVLAERIGV